MKHRVFIAIKVSDSLKKNILHWKQNYQKLPVRWIKETNLHITITPPFYTDNPTEIIDKLRSVSEKELCFTINFTRVITGPKEDDQRLIWVEGEKSKEIIKLKSEVEKVLDLKPEKRDFIIHLTLARIKRENIGLLKNITLERKVYWIESVDSFVLMESHLKPQGAEYEVLSEIGLLKIKKWNF